MRLQPRHTSPSHDDIVNLATEMAQMATILPKVARFMPQNGAATS